MIHSPDRQDQLFRRKNLAENAQALLGAVVKAKPAAAKGKYIKKITLTSTMGPGILIDYAEAESAVAARSSSKELRGKRESSA